MHALLKTYLKWLSLHTHQWIWFQQLTVQQQSPGWSWPVLTHQAAHWVFSTWFQPSQSPVGSSCPLPQVQSNRGDQAWCPESEQSQTTSVLPLILWSFDYYCRHPLQFKISEFLCEIWEWVVEYGWIWSAHLNQLRINMLYILGCWTLDH